jgi:hypothetical protein
MFDISFTKSCADRKLFSKMYLIKVKNSNRQKLHITAYVIELAFPLCWSINTKSMGGLVAKDR